MIKTRNTMDAWRKSLAIILNDGKNFLDENSRTCREVLNLVVEIEQPGIDAAGPIQALNTLHKWDYPPLDKIEQVILSKKLSAQHSYSYGPRLFHYQQLYNQVDDFIIPLLRDNPDSRRAILQFWDVGKDSIPLKRDVPSLVMLDCKLRDERLNITGIIRSNDMFFGWPANTYQMFVIQRYIAEKLRRKQGSITTISTSAHIFKDQFPYIEAVLRMKEEP